MPDPLPTPVDFDQLVREHQDVVVGLAHSMGLRGADLEDAAAEAFAAVFRALPSFRNDSALGTWVYRIAWRSILKVRNRRNANRTADTALDTRSMSQSDSIELTETSRVLWSAVHALDPMQSTAVELFYRRNWSVQDIAEVLCCPIGTVKTLLFRARAKLREKLGAMEVYR